MQYLVRALDESNPLQLAPSGGIENAEVDCFRVFGEEQRN